MSRQTRLVLLSGVALLALLASLSCPMTTYADEVTPPAQSTEQPAEPPAGEGETSSVEETAEAAGDEAQAGPLAEQSPTVAEVLEAAPEGTEVVVLNEQGEPEPLASQEAAEIIMAGDPIWCPAGQVPTPGANGCTPSYSALTEVVTELATGSYTGSGVIWIAADYSGTGATLAGGSLPALSAHNLTIQGGWSGTANNTSIVGQSTITTTPLVITGWLGNVTLRDLQIEGASPSGLYVSTSGDLLLDNVDANGNGAYGADLDTCHDVGAGCTATGDIAILDSQFDGNTGGGLQAHAGGNLLLDNVSASGNGVSGAVVTARGGSSNIFIHQGNFNNNGGGGLWAYGTGDMIVADTNASGNKDPFEFGGQLESGGSIVLDSSSFSNNAGGGLDATADDGITASGVAANGNGGEIGASLLSPLGNVSVNNGQFNKNALTGLLALAGNNLSLSSVSADGNGTFGALLVNLNPQGTAQVSNSSFDRNATTDPVGAGLIVISLGGVALHSTSASSNPGVPGALVMAGDVVLENAVFNSNGLDGVDVDTFGPGGPGNASGNLTVDGGTFTNNGEFGLDACDVAGTLVFLNPSTFGGNTAGDYIYRASSEGCVEVEPVAPPEESDWLALVRSLHEVQVGGGEQVELDCNAYTGTRLVLPNGDRVTFPCPLHDQAVLTGKQEASLPGPLPEGTGFVSGLEPQVIRDGQALTTLDASMLLEFVIPDGQQEASLVILRWDAAKSQWVEVPGGYADGNGRFVLTSSVTGVYVMGVK